MEHTRPGGLWLDGAGVVLLVWGLLLVWVSLPGVLAGRALDDGAMELLGVLLGALHVAAAMGIALRRGWSRTLGIAVGALGLLGSISVLAAFVAGIGAMLELAPGATPALLAIPVGMTATYLLAVVVLVRNADAFGGAT